MLHKSILVGLTVLSLLLLTPPKTSQAYQSNGDSQLTGLLERLVILTAGLNAKGYEIAHIGVDRVQLNKGYSFTRTLYTGNEYLVVGMGGVGISDLDIELYNHNGTLIDRDSSSNNTPIVSAYPRSNVTYRINVDLYALERGYDRNGEYLFVYIIAFKN